MGSHSITCHPAEVTFPPLPQPKLVLCVCVCVCVCVCAGIIRCEDRGADNYGRTSDGESCGRRLPLAADVERDAHVDARVGGRRVADAQRPRVRHRHPALVRAHRVGVLAPAHPRLRLAPRRPAAENDVRADGHVRRPRLLAKLAPEHCRTAPSTGEISGRNRF